MYPSDDRLVRARAPAASTSVRNYAHSPTARGARAEPKPSKGDDVIRRLFWSCLCAVSLTFRAGFLEPEDATDLLVVGARSNILR
jgi:hypothetical protein